MKVTVNLEYVSLQDSRLLAEFTATTVNYKTVTNKTESLKRWFSFEDSFKVHCPFALETAIDLARKLGNDDKNPTEEIIEDHKQVFTFKE